MDAVVLDIVCREVPHWLYGKRFAADFDLVALHYFLDGGADIAYAHVDPSSLSRLLAIAIALGIMSEARHLDPGVGGIFDRS